MKKLTKIFLALLSVVSILSTSSVQASTMEEIQEKGQLIVGMNAEYPPFEWVEVVDGQPEYYGIDVALGQLIADELGVELVIDNRAFDALIPSLQTKKIDIIISGMDHTEERAKQVDFSQSYFKEESQFAVRLGEGENFQSLEDFKDIKIGVQLGSTQEIYLKENHPDLELVSISKNSDLPEILKAKKVDAIFMSDITLAQLLLNYADSVEIVEAVAIENDGMGSAVALTKDNGGLTELIDQVILEAIESGKMDEIFQENIALANKDKSDQE